MALTTYGDISQRTAAWAATVMLAHAEPVLILQKFAQVKPMPKNKADTVKFRRPVPFTVATAPLVEGVTPSSQKMSYEDVTVAMKQYGAVSDISDVIVDLSEDPVLMDASMLSGEQAAATVEQICYGVVKAGTNVTYSNGSARSSVNTVISLNKQRAIVRSLKAQKARPINRILDGSIKIATTPVEGGYFAACHTDLEADIRNIAGFTPVAKYGSRNPICPEELGTIENVRYVTSPELGSFADAGDTAGSMVSTTGTDADVYVAIYFGMESFGVVPLKGSGAIIPSVINPNTPSKSDPLGQRGHVAWKTYFAAIILNQTWLHRLETAATDL